MSDPKFKLRDGSTVQDERLDRLVEFDEESRKYPARKLLTAAQKQPRNYHWRCPIVLDQEGEGACVGFAVAHELAAYPVMVPALDNNFGHTLYREAKKLDPWEGENYEGTSVLAGVKAAKKRGHFHEYRWCFGLQDLLLTVSYNGPVILGINWYDSMYDPIDDILHVGGYLAGGHAILCRGVNVHDRTLTLHNSWGPTWGHNGDAKISWNDMDRLLHEDGEAVVFVKRTSKLNVASTPKGLTF